MSKPDLGPWLLQDGKVYSGEEQIIAEVMGGCGGRFIDDDMNATCLANARLIAAAPDLLAACEMVARWLEMGREPNPDQLTMIREAIAKAKGD